MRCCVPFCNNPPENLSAAAGKRVSYHTFPSDVHLCAAWLKALGIKDTSLPDAAVVCSQHFLSDDMYKTESGIRQINTGAIPSTVQVCMICLDTDSKLILISKYKLEDAYEKLTGHPLCDQGNLKQTLCVQCAQRLVNFWIFREKILGTRSLIMDLVEKHKLVTLQHLQGLDRPKYLIKGNLVWTSLGPNHCDLHIVENPDENKPEETIPTPVDMVTVKQQCYDSPGVERDAEVPSDRHAVNVEFMPPEVPVHEYMNTEGMVLEVKPLDDTPGKALQRNPTASMLHDPLKCESASYKCTVCFQEFVHEYECNRHHLSTHMQLPNTKHVQKLFASGYKTSPGCELQVAASSKTFSQSVSFKTRRALKKNNKLKVAPVPTRLVTNNQRKVPPTKEAGTTKKNNRANEIDSSRVICNTLQTHTHCATNNIQFNYFSEKGFRTHSEKKVFLCDVCEESFERKPTLVDHIKTHNQVNVFYCKFCSAKCNNKFNLLRHMRTHTGEKNYACKLCQYKCARSCRLVVHMRTHTGEKPHSCNLCDYKCAKSCDLVTHMRTHTGEKPYSCKMCEFKCARSSNLLTHMRTHTGEKPYSCKVCEYKCARRSNLVSHMKTHANKKLKV